MGQSRENSGRTLQPRGQKPSCASPQLGVLRERGRYAPGCGEGCKPAAVEPLLRKLPVTRLRPRNTLAQDLVLNSWAETRAQQPLLGLTQTPSTTDRLSHAGVVTECLRDHLRTDIVTCPTSPRIKQSQDVRPDPAQHKALGMWAGPAGEAADLSPVAGRPGATLLSCCSKRPGGRMGREAGRTWDIPRN